MTDFNTMNEHLQDLLQEREDLWSRIHSLNQCVTDYFDANARLVEKVLQLETERDYWQRLAQANT
jgi:hypothetical protein